MQQTPENRTFPKTKKKMIGSKKNLQSRKNKKVHVAKSETFSMDPEFKFELNEERNQPRNPRRKLKRKLS